MHAHANSLGKASKVFMYLSPTFRQACLPVKIYHVIFLCSSYDPKALLGMALGAVSAFVWKRLNQPA